VLFIIDEILSFVWLGALLPQLCSGDSMLLLETLMAMRLSTHSMEKLPIKFLALTIHGLFFFTDSGNVGK